MQFTGEGINTSVYELLLLHDIVPFSYQVIKDAAGTVIFALHAIDTWDILAGNVVLDQERPSISDILILDKEPIRIYSFELETIKPSFGSYYTFYTLSAQIPLADEHKLRQLQAIAAKTLRQELIADELSMIDVSGEKIIKENLLGLGMLYVNWENVLMYTLLGDNKACSSFAKDFLEIENLDNISVKDLSDLIKEVAIEYDIPAKCDTQKIKKDVDKVIAQFRANLI